MHISELDLTVRSYNCLKRMGIETVEQLKATPVKDLKKIRNLGKKGLAEIIEKAGIES